MPAHKPHRHQKDMTASADKYPQGYFKTKPCRLCQNQFQPVAPSHLYCSQECTEEAMTDKYLQKTYGITYKDFHRMFQEQGGVCKICKKKGFALVKGQRVLLVVDHCHESKTVRGLLCHNCNRGLGLFQDNIEILKQAISYLEGATTIPQGSTSQAIGDGSAQPS